LVFFDIINHESYGRFYWANFVNGIRFRGKEETNEVSLDQTYAIIDSAEVCASFPESVYDFVQEYLLSLLSFSEERSEYGRVFYCSEIDRLPSLDLLLGSYWVEMQPDNFVLNYGGNLCGLCFKKSS